MPPSCSTGCANGCDARDTPRSTKFVDCSLSPSTSTRPHANAGTTSPHYGRPTASTTPPDDECGPSTPDVGSQTPWRIVRFVSVRAALLFCCYYYAEPWCPFVLGQSSISELVTLVLALNQDF